jgi:tRNA (pseudouridine54-N1)-methyltransferase
MSDPWRPRRRFLLVGHTQTTTPDFALNDLTSGAGRLDVLVRMVTAGFCLSHGIRRDTELWAVLPGRSGDDVDEEEGPLTVRFEGGALRGFNPDERSTAALFKRAFSAEVVAGGRFVEAHPGIQVARMGFKEALKKFAALGPVLLLDRDGVDIRELDASDLEPASDGTGPGFVLSDHESFSGQEEKALKQAAKRSVSVGPLWLHGHGALTIVHDELDRRSGPSPTE